MWLKLWIALVNAYRVISFSAQFIEIVIVASNTSPLFNFKNSRIVLDKSIYLVFHYLQRVIKLSCTHYVRLALEDDRLRED